MSERWHDLSDPPPEGVKVWVRLKNGTECQAIRQGKAIHVGVPASFHPEVVQWMEADNAEEDEGIAMNKLNPDRHEFLEQYSDVLVTFSSYYKYRFTYRGVMPDGSELMCQKGGDIDSIYRLDVNNEPISLGELWPDTVEVRNSEGLLITWF